MDPSTLGFLIAAGFVASFIDAQVGGGGAISLPALLSAGLPPHVALGTNKLAGTGASLTATARYARAGVLDKPLSWSLVPYSLAGSLLGAATVLSLDAAFVRNLVVVLVVALTIYVLIRPHFGGADAYQGPTPWMRAIAGSGVAFAVGFYDGFLGPGTGSLFLFAFVAIHRMGFVRAAAHGRLLNFASNIAALGFFAAAGSIDYATGLPMMGAMLAGAYVGSGFTLKHGARWLRPLFVVVTAVLLLRLLFA